MLAYEICGQCAKCAKMSVTYSGWWYPECGCFNLARHNEKDKYGPTSKCVNRMEFMAFDDRRHFKLVEDFQVAKFLNFVFKRATDWNRQPDGFYLLFEFEGEPLKCDPSKEIVWKFNRKISNSLMGSISYKDGVYHSASEAKMKKQFERNDNILERWRRSASMITEGQKACDALSAFVNNFAYEKAEFVEAVMKEHRTLQQQMMVCFMACVEEWAKLKDKPGFYDGRNKATVELAAKIKDAVGDDMNLPLI